MSEIELIYKFLSEFEQYAPNISITKDGGYLVQMRVYEGYSNGFYGFKMYIGKTIGDAIRKFYEAQEKETTA